MRKPYIGVSGITLHAQGQEAVDHILPLPNHFVMIGVLVSSKTLSGQQNRYPNRYPNVRHIRSVFPIHPCALNLIHFSTDFPNGFQGELEQLVKLGGPNLHGFQLNMVWPDAEQIRRALEGKNLRTVLQIGPRAMTKVGNDPEILVIRLSAYTDMVTDVLLDASGGLGKDLDLVEAERMVKEIHDRFPQLGIGIAGGLSSQTLPRLKPLVQQFPFLSIDAEGKLRTPAPEDQLDQETVHRYLAAAKTLFPNS